MGCWGMGIAQSDEYCEIYDRFMEEYDEGKPLSDIEKDILDECLDEFDKSDGILHDVYFAIGKAEWMCGGISDDIYDKISHIIESGDNITFYRELGAIEADLKQRKKNLDRFLASLSSPRGKTKKRKVQTEKYVAIEKPKLPSFRCGDVFAYIIDGKYRFLGFVNRGRFMTTYAAYCYVWPKLYEQIPPVNELTDEPIVPLGYFTVESFPDMEKLKLIGNMPDMVKLDIHYPGILYEQWKPATWVIAKEEQLSENYPMEMWIKFSDCLNKLQVLNNSADTN